MWGRKPPSRSPSSDASDVENLKTEEQEEAYQEFIDEVEELENDVGEFVGYVLPFKADDPLYYQFAYGVKARDVVDLFSVYYRQLNFKKTVQSILTVMKDADKGFNYDLPLPDSISSIEGNVPNRVGAWSGKTVREILGARAGGKKPGNVRNKNREQYFDFTDMTEDQAFRLLQQGAPGAKPRIGKEADPKARAEAVRPAGLLIEMFRAWQSSGAAERADREEVDPLQLRLIEVGPLQLRLT